MDTITLPNGEHLIEVVHSGDRWHITFDAEHPTIRYAGPTLAKEADRAERPDFGVLGSIDETLAQAGIDPTSPPLDASGLNSERSDATLSLEPGAVNTVLPSSPLLCATLDEVRRFAESQGKGRYSPESDRRVALDLIAAMAGILGRPVPDQTPPAEFDEPKSDADWIGLEARTRALDMAVRARPGFSSEFVVKDAEAYHAFLTAAEPPAGKVYATKADVDGLHERIDMTLADLAKRLDNIASDPIPHEHQHEYLMRSVKAIIGALRPPLTTPPA